MSIILEKDNLFVSYVYLKENGISNNTLKTWQKRAITTRIERGIDYFILYDTIPAPTRSKLPSKDKLIALYRLHERGGKVDELHKPLKHAFEVGYRVYVDHYRLIHKLSDEKAIDFAKNHAVWQWIYDNYTDRNLETLFAAYDKIYSNRYKNKYSLSNMVKKLKRDGVEKSSMDNRIFMAPKNVKKVTADNKLWVAALTSIGKKYGPVDIHRKVVSMCEKNEATPPSLSWVKKYHKEIKQNPQIFQSRNGALSSRGKKETYTTMIHALNANSQWQLDGWTLPFWGADFQRYVVVVVRDAYSKKILGYHLSESENTITIYNAIRDAVVSTGYLPGEIVMDNHSFNKTKEADYLKANTEAFGTQWTITENPQYKSIIERYFGYLDNLCKGYTGYLGEGIKSRNINAHPKPELMEAYSKSFLTKDEITCIIIQVIDAFNNQILAKEGRTPNEMYDTSEKKHCFTVGLFDRVRILTPKTESTVLRGQINIIRSNIKYEYQLDAATNLQYDNKTVIVQYEDLKDCIYLYDRNTGKAICSVPQKPRVHGAKVDQTEKDIELLNKHKGRKTSINSQAKKGLKEQVKDALAVNPNAIDQLTEIGLAKDVLQEMKQMAHLKERAEQMGVNVNSLPNRTTKSEIDTSMFDYDDEEPMISRNPCRVKGSMRRINVDEEFLDK